MHISPKKKIIIGVHATDEWNHGRSTELHTYFFTTQRQKTHRICLMRVSPTKTKKTWVYATDEWNHQRSTELHPQIHFRVGIYTYSTQTQKKNRSLCNWWVILSMWYWITITNMSISRKQNKNKNKKGVYEMWSDGRQWVYETWSDRFTSHRPPVSYIS